MLEQAFANGHNGPAEQAYASVQNGSADRINRILALVSRLRDIDQAIDRIRYDNEMVTELANVLTTLGDAKDAVIAELKTV